jgi:hypothetical protein
MASGVPAPEWGPHLGTRVVEEVAGLVGGRLRPEIAAWLSEVTVRGYSVFLARLYGDEDGAPEQMAALVGDLFDDVDISLEDAMALHRHLEQVLLREVRESGPPDLVAMDGRVLETASHRFFNDLGAALADGYLQARRGHETDRTVAERELLGCVLASPPRLGEARRMARALDLDLNVPWEVTVVASERRSDGLRARVRRALWGADVLIGSCPAGLVVAVHRSAGPAQRPELGRGVVCGVGDTHPDVRGLRASYEEALEALELARRKGLPVLRFDDAWFDRFLLGAVSAEELAEVVLAPIADLSPSRRAAVLETLEAYLDSGSSVAAVADALHLHRQSVNYRMHNVRKLFAERMRSPHGRLALHIAVKAARLQRS